MGARRGTTLALVLAPLFAAPAQAQLSASLHAGAGREQFDPDTRSVALLLQPSFSFRSSRAQLDLEGGLARFAGGELTAEAATSAWWRVTGSPFAGLQVGLDAAGAWYEARGRNGLLQARARIGIGDEHNRAWFGGAVGAADAGSGLDPARAIEVGGRVSVGGVTVGLSAGQRGFERRFTTIRDSVVVLPPDTVVPVGRFEVTETTPHSYADGELTLGWSRGRVGLEVAIGGRIGDSLVPTESWARVDALVGLAPAVSAVLSAGRTPGQPERGLGSRPYFLLGFSLSLPARHPPAPPASRPVAGLQVLDGPSGARVIQIRIEDARRVELMGDFTDWRPLAMKPVGAGLWQLKLQLDPGLYRMNLRIDGGPWIVPPGLTPVPDEFNGSVGQLVIDR